MEKYNKFTKMEQCEIKYFQMSHYYTLNIFLKSDKSENEIINSYPDSSEIITNEFSNYLYSSGIEDWNKIRFRLRNK